MKNESTLNPWWNNNRRKSGFEIKTDGDERWKEKLLQRRQRRRRNNPNLEKVQYLGSAETRDERLRLEKKTNVSLKTDKHKK